MSQVILGIDNRFDIVADVPFTSNIVAATVGLTSPIAANQTQRLRAWVRVAVGATGGVKVTPVIPVGASLVGTIGFHNTVAPSYTPATLTTSGAGNALANAGTHWVLVDMVVANGATAGSVDLQFCQNTSDANTLTVLKFGFLEVIKFQQPTS